MRIFMRLPQLSVVLGVAAFVLTFLGGGLVAALIGMAPNSLPAQGQPPPAVLSQWRAVGWLLGAVAVGAAVAAVVTGQISLRRQSSNAAKGGMVLGSLYLVLAALTLVMGRL